MNNIEESIKESIEVKHHILRDKDLLKVIEDVALEMISTFTSEGKVLFCGNGGSAADAQHLAAELSGRYKIDRPGLYAEALHVNTSYLTAVANDYSFEDVYARMVIATGKEKDILFAISTSGNSKNILKAIDAAISMDMTVVGMTGESGGKMRDKVHYLINVPSEETPRIQESHIMIGHIICDIVESRMFAK